jgi:hypothetical protein
MSHGLAKVACRAIATSRWIWSGSRNRPPSPPAAGMGRADKNGADQVAVVDYRHHD